MLYKKNVLFYKKILSTLSAAAIALSLLFVFSNSKTDTRVQSETGSVSLPTAIVTRTYNANDLVTSGFCLSTYVSNEGSNSLTLRLDNTTRKVTRLTWNNRSRYISTNGADFVKLLEYIAVREGGGTWTYGGNEAEGNEVIRVFFNECIESWGHWNGALVWPGDLTKVPQNIFNSYYSPEKLFNWTSVRLSDGCTTIGDGAFEGITSLADVWFPSSIVSVGEYAFAFSNIEIAHVEGDDLKEIKQYAFYNCPELSQIYIYSSRTSGISLGAMCFAYNNYTDEPDDRSVLIHAIKISTIGDNAFLYNYGNKKINHFDFEYKGNLNDITLGSAGPFGSTQADEVHVTWDMVSDYKAWLNSYPATTFFDNCAPLPARSVSLALLSEHNDEIKISMSNATDTGQYISVYSEPHGYAEPLDYSKLAFTIKEVPAMSDTTPIADMEDTSGLTITRDDETENFKLHIAAGNDLPAYFKLSGDGSISKCAFIAVNYNSSQIVRYKSVYLYTDTDPTKPTSDTDYSFYVNGNKYYEAPGHPSTITTDLSDRNADDIEFYVNTVWYDSAGKPNVSSNDVTTIDSSIDDQPNIAYYADTKTFVVHAYVRPQTVQFTLDSVTGNLVHDADIAFKFDRKPSQLIVFTTDADTTNNLLIDTLGALEYDVSAKIYDVKAEPNRSDENVKWEIVQDGQTALPHGVYVKGNMWDGMPAYFPGTLEEWYAISEGQVWWTSDVRTYDTGKSFKLKATSLSDPTVFALSPAQTVYVVDINIHTADILSVKPLEPAKSEIVVVAGRTYSWVVEFIKHEAFANINLDPYIYAVEVEGSTFLPGLDLEHSSTAQTWNSITVNTNATPGEYKVGLVGGSKSLSRISMQEYDITFIVVPAPNPRPYFPIGVILLISTAGLFVIGSATAFSVKAYRKKQRASHH